MTVSDVLFQEEGEISSSTTVPRGLIFKWPQLIWPWLTYLRTVKEFKLFLNASLTISTTLVESRRSLSGLYFLTAIIRVAADIAVFSRDLSFDFSSMVLCSCDELLLIATWTFVGTEEADLLEGVLVESDYATT